MERVIIMTRELYFYEVRYMRMLTPLIEAGIVRKLQEKSDILEFVVDLTREAGGDRNFESYVSGLIPPHSKPSDIYEMFLMHHPAIPPMYIATYNKGEYYHIEKATTPALRDFIERIDEDHIIPYLGGAYAANLE